MDGRMIQVDATMGLWLNDVWQTDASAFVFLFEKGGALRLHVYALSSPV